jgi:hypothetical protein
MSSAAEENTLEEWDGALPTSAVMGLTWSLFAIAFVFSISTCVVCCCACCARQNSHPVHQRPGGVRGKHIALTSAAIVLVFASILAGSFAISRRVLEKQDYKGLMRITGWSLSDTFTQSSEDSNDRANYKHYIEAEMTLEWGYAWACAEHGDKACVSTGDKTVTRCKTQICVTRKESSNCQEEELELAKTTLEQCANGYFDPSLASSGYYVPFDPTEGPSMDENWPSLAAYGECKECRARDNVPSTEALDGLRVSSIVFLVVAFGFLGGAVVYWVRDTKRQDELHNQESSLPVSEVVSPGSGVPMVLPEQNSVFNPYLQGSSYNPAGVPVVTPQVYNSGVTPYVHSANAPAIPVVTAQLEQSPMKNSGSPPIVYAKPLDK